METVLYVQFLNFRSKHCLVSSVVFSMLLSLKSAL